MKGPSRKGRWLARFEACPKCQGQYRRDGWTCHCYQCCFEWDLRDPVEQVLARALRRHVGERPQHHFWEEPLWQDETGPGGALPSSSPWKS